MYTVRQVALSVLVHQLRKIVSPAGRAKNPMRMRSRRVVVERLVAKAEVATVWVQFHTDKKENKIFLIYQEIQKGAVAKSYMANGLLNPHI
jgi:hypothetical protein